jgi:uncharacterized protein (DUF2164 family)
MEDAFGHRGNEWDEVRTLFGGYLHQDFIDDYGDEWGAVRQYCADATASHITAAADELADVLENFQNEKQLEVVADRLGSAFYPPGVGQTYRGWMSELERFLRAASTAPRD